MSNLLTERQQEIYDLYQELGSNQKVAKKLGLHRRTVDKSMNIARAKLAKAGYGEVDVSRHVGPGYKIKGKSTLVNAQTGAEQLIWVKTDQDKEQQEALMREAIEALKADVKPQKAIKAPKKTHEQLLNNYVITDYHLGMLAWGEETGDDWDLEIAERTLLRWFKVAIDQSPNAAEAVFCQLGDFLHWDGFDAVTPTSGHLLDADTRFQKLVRASIKIIRQIINMLLEKHTKVTVIMAEGNHDMSSSIWLREMFAELYRKDKRVTVDINPDPYYCYEFGKTSLFFHHGHKKKPQSIADVFTAKFREIFGRTKHSYAHLGHFHHNLVQENNLMTVEQHRTLAAKDAHASRGGYSAGRDAKVITYSKEYGEVGRLIINYDMVMDS